MPFFVLRKMFMVQICVFFCTITIPIKTQAQLYHVWDSIVYYMQFKPSLTADFDSKNTFVTGHGVPMKGLELGISFKNKISYMLGVYFLREPIYNRATLYKGTTKEATYNTQVYINYWSLIAEYSIYRSRRWNIYMPFQIGTGFAKKYYYDSTSLKRADRSRIVPVELSITGNYRIWKFIGLSGGLGYRRAFSSNIIKDEDFNGITYSFGIKIWFGDLCYLVAPKCKYCKYL